MHEFHNLIAVVRRLIDVSPHITPNEKADLHALADVAAAALPGPEKMAAEVVADVTADKGTAADRADVAIQAVTSDGASGA